MSITIQTLFIAKKTKKQQLEQQLLQIKEFALKAKALHYEVFQCDEEENEFLLYEQWTSQANREAFHLTSEYKLLEKKRTENVHRVEELNLM